ncbi:MULTISPECIES: hypothetical protein [Pantoea]|uniref:hypothetical protein n=1 Tax=Pantoea TaxID=53335 RepID=UPI001653F324|nr:MULTISPECIES: hypothetical protein [Pantoea]
MYKNTSYTRRPGITTTLSLRLNDALPVAPENRLFADSDEGGERAAILCSLMGTCRLNGVYPGT